VSKEIDMPESAVPFLVFYIGAFLTFIVAIGGAALWTGQK
jgi:hypothetical protein